MRTAVIGAGYAGMAAAVTLVEAGGAVTVFDSARVPGGRARQVTLHGVPVDNGQHILLGAYHTLLQLMTVVHGPQQAAVCLERMPLCLELPGHLRIAAKAWPGSLGLLAGLLTSQGLSWRQRLRLIRFMRRVPALATTQDDRSVDALLAAEGQDGELSRLLWQPLCLAALNTPAHQASARVFLRVLRDSLCAGRHDADLLLPRVDLTALFPGPAADWLAARGQTLRFGQRVTAIEPQATGCVVHTGAQTEIFDQVILAVGPHQLSAIAGLDRVLEDTQAVVSAFAWQPITTVWLQFDSVRLPAPMLGRVDGYSQWVFDRGWCGGPAGLINAVISGDGPHSHLNARDLAAAVEQELRQQFDLPAARWRQAITEKRATFSCDVGLQRPPMATGHSRLWLAGDYVDGPYPATLEGAVQSGIAAARAVLSGTTG